MRRIFYAKINYGRSSSSSCPCSIILQSIYKRCPYGTWNLSCSLCKLYPIFSAQRKLEFMFSENCNDVSLSWSHGVRDRTWRLMKGKLRQPIFMEGVKSLMTPQLNGLDIAFVNNVMYIGVTWQKDMETSYWKDWIRGLSLLHRDLFSIQKWGFSTNIKFMLWLCQLWLMLVSHGSMRQALTSCNCSACRTGYSPLLEILTGAHHPTNCTWLSKFLVCITI
jgi:hypothetical protein